MLGCRASAIIYQNSRVFGDYQLKITINGRWLCIQMPPLIHTHLQMIIQCLGGFVCSSWDESRLPRDPLQPPRCHHSSTPGCRHADGDGDGDWRSLFNADAHKNIIYQKLTPFVSHKRWALFVSESGKINPPLCFKFCHSFQLVFKVVSRVFMLFG